MDITKIIRGELTEKEIEMLRDIAAIETQCDGLACINCPLHIRHGECLATYCSNAIKRNTDLIGGK